MHILFSFLIIAFVTPHILFGADNTSKTTPLTQQWLDLSYDFHTCSNAQLTTVFKTLNTDVQGKIMAQIHPRQTIDELASDHFILVRQLTVPHIIASWDIKDDNFIYYTKKERHEELYGDEYHFDMYRLKLAYGQNTQILKNETIYEKQRPKLAICSNSVVFETKGNYLNIIKFKKPKNKWEASTSSIYHIAHSFVCHPKLPLLAIFDTEQNFFLYNVDENKMIDSKTRNHRDIHKHLQWHPTFPFAMATQKRTNDDVYLHHFGLFKENKEIASGYFTSFRGAPCISYDGQTIWGGSGDPCARMLSNYTCTSHEYGKPAEIENRTLRAVGERYYLTEDKEESSEKTCFTLRSTETKEEVKKITSFKNHDPALSRLPQNHDYRYVTIAIDEQKPQSTISIAVPASSACIEHYCMFQAALSAEKATNAENWNLFKKPDYHNLITATAAHYPHFKKLMITHKIMTA